MANQCMRALSSGMFFTSRTLLFFVGEVGGFLGELFCFSWDRTGELMLIVNRPFFSLMISLLVC